MKAGMTDLYSGAGAHVSIDPKTIRLLGDRVLIQDLPEEEQSLDGAVETEKKVGSIIIPSTIEHAKGVGKQGKLRLGVVIAVGPGDATIDIVDKAARGIAWGDEIRRRPITERCRCCDNGTVGWTNWDGSCHFVACSECSGTGRVPIRAEVQCRPGDRVIYEKRLSERMFIGGVPFFMVHSEQACWAVVENGN